MFMQAEIADLEERYKNIVADENHDPETAKLSRPWIEIVKNYHESNPGFHSRRRYEIILELRRLLRDYSKRVFLIYKFCQKESTVADEHI